MSACPKCESTEFESYGSAILKDGTKVKLFRCKKCGMQLRDSYRYNKDKPRVKALRSGSKVLACSLEEKPKELRIRILKTVKRGTRGRPRVIVKGELDPYVLDVYGKTLRFKRRGEKFVVLK